MIATGILAESFFLLEFIFPHVSFSEEEDKGEFCNIGFRTVRPCFVCFIKKKKKDYLNLHFLVLKVNRVFQVSTASFREVD